MVGRWVGESRGGEYVGGFCYDPAMKEWWSVGQLDPGGSNRGGRTCPDSEYIWKAQPTGCTGRLDERKSNG